MQCEQIRPLLDQYAEGSLAGYKVSWVVQHLAGCSECAAAATVAHSAAQRRPAASASPRATARAAQAAVTAATQRRPAEDHLEDVQRPVPHWLRWVAVLLIAAAAGGAAWLLLGSPAPHPGQHAASSGVVGSTSPVA